MLTSFYSELLNSRYRKMPLKRLMAQTEKCGICLTSFSQSLQTNLHITLDSTLDGTRVSKRILFETVKTT